MSCLFRRGVDRSGNAVARYVARINNTTAWCRVIYAAVVLGHLFAGLLACGDPPAAAPAGHEMQKTLETARRFLRNQERTWREDNGCFSCHNQGIALRALWISDPPDGSDPTAVPQHLRRWLVQPATWQTVDDPAGGDQRLADLHFGRAALAGQQRGILEIDQHVRAQIGRQIVAHLREGHWPADVTSPLASPLSPGPMWGTLLACQILEECDSASQWRPALQAAYQWILQTAPGNTPDVAAQLIAALPAEQHAVLDRCFQQLRDSQNPDGGWGPFPGKPSEPFDTALVLIALGRLLQIDNPPEVQRVVRERITRGQTFLVRTQQPDGGWPETTRPPGRESYPLRIATTAWVVEALGLTCPLSTRAK
ncbi:MAG: hypothetical protein KatS3mg110_4473 [Pirellulaceae bacterium]|nr:MAG: hypothetical protein KatS3mg110_4473 [Pirellulaceae bacterium]